MTSSISSAAAQGAAREPRRRRRARQLDDSVALHLTGLSRLVLRFTIGRDKLELSGPHPLMRSKGIFESAEA